MDAVVNNFQVGQKFGSGTIVNPSQVSSEQLKGSKLVTVLVPTGGLAEGEKLDLQTQSAPVKLNGLHYWSGF